VLRLKVERTHSTVWMQTLIPVIAILVTFLLTSIFILWAGANPFSAYYHFIVSPLSSRFGQLEVLVKSTPLILTGMAVIFAFRAGYFNIGAEGQLYAGAMSAAWLGVVLNGVPQVIAIPLMVLGGFVAGALWALPPAILKVKLKVDEVVTTLLLNTVVLFVVSWLLNGPWRDKESGWPQSPEILENTMFFKLVERSRLHFGFLLAIITMFVVWYVITRTPLGLRMRAVGLGSEAARFAGINVPRTMLTAALVSGGIAGLAGVSEVAGIHFHLIEAISPGFGYTGIIVATLSGLQPFVGAAAALFLGLIDTGAQTVSRALGVPVYLGNVVQATLLLVTLALFILQNYRIRRA
jgi:general nucleoside transport system permease protein